MPDIFVPTDTSGYSKYYFNVMNAGLLHKFAFNYVDANRAALLEAADTDELLELLPSDLELLSKFVIYASNEAKVPTQWYYINISRNLLVSQLKALIARDLFGIEGYYEVINPTDNTVNRALELLDSGSAGFPIVSNAPDDKEQP